MSRIKALTFAAIGMLILGCCMPSVKALAAEDDGSYLFVYDEDGNSIIDEDGNAIFEGSAEESWLYNDAPGYPIATDFGWVKPGEFYVNVPDDSLYYYVYIGGAGAHDVWKMTHSGNVNCTICFTESGTYTMQVRTQNNSNFNSEIKSIEYTKPAEVLATPTGLRWDARNAWTVAWDPVQDANYYLVTVYKNGDMKARGIRAITEKSPYTTFDVSRTFSSADPTADEYTFDVRAYNTDLDFRGCSEISARSAAYAGTNLNGLAPGADGWYLYENGKVNTYYNGLYYDDEVGWWLIFNGSVAFDYNDLYYDETYGWWKIVGGAVDFGYNDLFGSPAYGWWKVTGGTVDFGYSELYESPTYGWWKVTGGAVDFGYNDLYGSPTYGWWKVTGGAVDFGYTDLFGSPTCGWWKVTGGAVDFGYNDLYGSPLYGWWLVSGGAVDFGYTDIYNSPSVGNWKVSGGAVDFGYYGYYNSPKYGRCYVRGGQANL